MMENQDNQGIEVAGYCVRCGVRLDSLAVDGSCLDCQGKYCDCCGERMVAGECQFCLEDAD